MDVEDALELLGPSFKHPGVRKYAVGRMRSSPDNDLQLYLLQLVQALKYEKFSTNTTKNKIIEDGSLSSSQVYSVTCQFLVVFQAVFDQFPGRFSKKDNSVRLSSF